MARVFYDDRQFRPTAHRVRLDKPGEDRFWSEQGWWPVGLDWRPGAPTFRSMIILTEAYRRLLKLYDRYTRGHQDDFQLRVVPVDEEGVEMTDLAFSFVPTMPIDDEDREEFQRWQSAA